jgi:TusA-related sulfurtransferase
MRRWAWLSVAVTAVVVAGCEDKPAGTQPSSTATAEAPAPPPTASATASAAPSGSAANQDAKGGMKNCPNAVEGATTEMKNVDHGIEITVKGKDAAAAKEIRERAGHLAAASKDPAQAGKHTGTGQGGGQFGRCPVVMKDTTVVAADVEGGSKLTVTVKDDKIVDWLRREAAERNATLGTAGEGAGKGKMQHCPSAVSNATTVVKESKDGVVVTVTAKEEEGTKDIRERTKHIVEAAKKDPKDVKHDGAGDGGGGSGRCPVVLKDTKVTAKDVPGGAEITVVPEKKEDLDTVRTQAKERAEKFQNPGAEPAGAASASAAPAAGKAPKK